jgi:CRISPR/Cas system CSM-associated protein Csm2 small subunit
MAFVTLLEKQKEFFESYKSKFLEILKDEIRKVDGKEVNIQKFLNYANLLYDAFLNQDSPTLLEKLKKVLYEAFKNLSLIHI